MSKDGRINFILTTDERDKLKSLAIKNNMTISKYMREMVIYNIMNEDNINTTYIPETNITDTKRTKEIHMLLSEEEYNIIKDKAGKKTLSEYIRSAALKGNKTIKVEVYDDDIVDLERKVQPQIDRLFNII